MVDKVKVGKNVYLRRITSEDTNMVVQWRNSKEVKENFIYRTPLTYESHIQWYERYVVSGEIDDFIICDNYTNEALGCVYLQKYELEHHRAEDGIFLGTNTVRGRGIGSEALRLLIEYGFEQKKLHKIVARVLASNMVSLRLHEKVGFQREAYFKDEVYIDGKYCDIVMLGMILNKD